MSADSSLRPATPSLPDLATIQALARDDMAAVDALIRHRLASDVVLINQVAEYIEDKRLRVVLADFEAPPRPIHVVYPHARLLPARTRFFVDWLRRELKFAG